MLETINQVIDTYFMINEMLEEGDIIIFSFTDKDNTDEIWTEYQGYFIFHSQVNMDIFRAISTQFPAITNISANFNKATKVPSKLGYISTHQIPIYMG